MEGINHHRRIYWTAGLEVHNGKEKFGSRNGTKKWYVGTSVLVYLVLSLFFTWCALLLSILLFNML